MIFSTKMLKKLIQEKCPPQTETELVYASVLMALSERIDKTDAQLSEHTKALRVVASIVSGAPKEDAASTQAEEPSRPVDQTPFPAGVPERAASAPAPAEEIPTPDAGSNVAMNASPIPRRAKNGSKEVQ